jgi:hypothetical protein
VNFSLLNISNKNWWTSIVKLGRDQRRCPRAYCEPVPLASNQWSGQFVHRVSLWTGCARSKVFLRNRRASKFLVVFLTKRFSVWLNSCMAAAPSSFPTSIRWEFLIEKTSNQRKQLSLFRRESKRYIIKSIGDWSMCRSVHVCQQPERAECLLLSRLTTHCQSVRRWKNEGCA